MTARTACSMLKLRLLIAIASLRQSVFRRLYRWRWWYLPQLLIVLLWCKCDLVSLTTSGYSLQASHQNDGTIVSTFLLRRIAAGQWRKSYFLKNNIIDAGNYAFILNIEDARSQYEEVSIESILLSSSKMSWNQPLLGANASQTISVFGKSGPATATAFIILGATKDSQDPYDINIPRNIDTVIAVVTATLIDKHGSKVRTVWRLPMRLEVRTRYMSYALAHMVG
jgi:hypothetical protein